MLPWITTALLTGLISSLHCVGMCGPLVAALPVGRLPRQQRWRAVGVYHAGRLITYAGLGSLAGCLSLGVYLLGWQRPLALLGGGILLLNVGWRRGRAGSVRWPWLNRQVSNLFRHYLRQPGLPGFAGLGVLNGLLPCGFTYLALTGTLVANTPLAGGIYMLAFGLGTLPALLSVNLATNWPGLSWPGRVGRQWVGWFTSVATVAVALLLLGRGLADYRLPSPSAPAIPVCHGLLTR